MVQNKDFMFSFQRKFEIHTRTDLSMIVVLWQAYLGGEYFIGPISRGEKEIGPYHAMSLTFTTQPGMQLQT